MVKLRGVVQSPQAMGTPVRVVSAWKSPLHPDRGLNPGECIADVALLLIGSALGYLYAERRGPFSKGSDRKAFLGATYGMTGPEVERATGLKLVPWWQFKADYPIGADVPFLLAEEFDLVDREMQEHYSRLYSSKLTVFDTAALARFEFFDEQLVGVEVRFTQWDDMQAEALMKRLTTAISGAYKDSTREEEPKLGYRLVFTDGKRSATLWHAPTRLSAKLNTTLAPEVSAVLSDSTVPDGFRERRKHRDANAF